MVIQQDDAKKPLPRYEQGAALMGPNLYIMGGHYSKQSRGWGLERHMLLPGQQPSLVPSARQQAVW